MRKTRSLHLAWAVGSETRQNAPPETFRAGFWQGSKSGRPSTCWRAETRLGWVTKYDQQYNYQSEGNCNLRHLCSVIHCKEGSPIAFLFLFPAKDRPDLQTDDHEQLSSSTALRQYIMTYCRLLSGIRAHYQKHESAIIQACSTNKCMSTVYLAAQTLLICGASALICSG
jgi:hypothetical protein